MDVNTKEFRKGPFRGDYALKTVCAIESVLGTEILMCEK